MSMDTRDTLLAQADTVLSKVARILDKLPAAIDPGTEIKLLTLAAEQLNREMYLCRRNPQSATLLIRRMEEVERILETLAGKELRMEGHVETLKPPAK